MSIIIHKVMSIRKTCSNVMSFCKTQINKVFFYARHFGFVRRVFTWSQFWDMSGLKMCLCVLDCVFSGSIFFYFYSWRHVYGQYISYIWRQGTIFTVYKNSGAATAFCKETPRGNCYSQFTESKNTKINAYRSIAIYIFTFNYLQDSYQ